MLTREQLAITAKLLGYTTRPIVTANGLTHVYAPDGKFLANTVSGLQAYIVVEHMQDNYGIRIENWRYKTDVG